MSLVGDVRNFPVQVRRKGFFLFLDGVSDKIMEHSTGRSLVNKTTSLYSSTQNMDYMKSVGKHPLR